MTKILILMAPGFEEIELTAPVDILRRLGVSVDIAGVESLQVEAAHGMVMQADMLLADVDGAQYDGIVLPGGQGSWVLRDSAAVLRLVEEMSAQKKLVAAICAAPIVLEAAGVLQGKSVCCYPAEAVVSELKSVAGIENKPVVRDGHIITGRGPGAAFDFAFALGEYCCDEAVVAAMREEMCML